jgi:hypothetical protein
MSCEPGIAGVVVEKMHDDGPGQENAGCINCADSDGHGYLRYVTKLLITVYVSYFISYYNVAYYFID